MDNKDIDHLFKVMLVGDSGVGKSCVVTRFIDGDFTDGVGQVTGGIVFKHVVFDVGTCVVKLQLWDSVGQDRFRDVTRMHFKNKDAFLLFYDVNKRSSFERVSMWLSDIIASVKNPVLYLVANKCDYDNNLRTVSTEEGEKLATNYDMPYFETSARTGVSVDSMFQEVGRGLIDRKI